MERNSLKRPTLDEFRKAFEASNGNATNAARVLGVTRQTIYNWIKENEEFASVLMDSRKALLDKCISTAQIVAFGIPRLDASNRVIGWEEKPDSHMLRYFMSTLGRDEGFGDSLDIRTSGAVGVNLFKTIDAEDFATLGAKFDEQF